MTNAESEIQLDIGIVKEPRTENSSDGDDYDYSQAEIIQNDEEVEERSNQEEKEDTLSEVHSQNLRTKKEKQKPFESTKPNQQNQSKLNKENKTKATATTQLTQSNRVTNTIASPNESKSLFTQITEDIFQQYITTESKTQPRLYDILLSDTYISKINKQSKSKDNQIKFQNMLDRHHQYSDSLNLKLNLRQEKENEEFKLKYTFKPHATNRDNPIRNIGEFYSEQKRFVDKRNKTIQRLKDAKENKEKRLMSQSPQISKKSTQLVESRYSNENDNDVFKRLHTSKMMTSQNNKLKQNKKNKLISPRAKTQRCQRDIDKYANKLHSQKYLLKSKRKEKAQKIFEEEKQRSNNLITMSTKKVILNKILNSFNKGKLALINNEDNDKKQISYDEYCLIMKQMGFINDDIGDQYLLKTSYEKYIHQEINYCLLFVLTVIGIYTGRDNSQSEKAIQRQSLSQSNTFTNNKTKRDKYLYEDLIKQYFPFIDLNTYYYSLNAVNKIRTAYSKLYTNLSNHWAKQRANNKQSRRNNNNKSVSIPHEKESKDNVVKQFKQKKLTKRRIRLQKDNIDIKLDNIRDLKIEDTYKYYQQLKNKELNYLRDKKSKEELKECTFQPNANSRKIGQNLKGHIEKLYNEGKSKGNCHKNIYSEELKHIEAKELNKCTFRPMIYSLNLEMFNNDPLSDDIKLKKELELREQARLNKNIISIQLNKRFTSTGFSAFNSLYSTNTHIESTPSMRFDIEKRTFNRFKHNVVCNRNSYRKFKTNSTYSNRDKSRSLIPILNVEINIDDKHKGAQLIIFKGDDPLKVTSDFCVKYDLSESKREQIQSIIQNKLKEIN